MNKMAEIDKVFEKEQQKLRKKAAEKESADIEAAFAYQRAMTQAVVAGRKKSDRLAALDKEIEKERNKWNSSAQ